MPATAAAASAAAASSSSSPLTKVVLNVGGHRFETSAATLSRVPRSYFTRLLSGAVQCSRDADGAYFLDRDGHLFHHILTWLRAYDPASPLQRSTNLLVSFRNEQWDKVCDVTGLPRELYGSTATRRAFMREVEHYQLLPLLFALDPTAPAVANYKPGKSEPGSREELDRAMAAWEGESNVPDVSVLRAYQAAAADPKKFSSTSAASTAEREAEQAVSDFDELGGFGPLLDGVKASLLSGNGEVTWTPPAGFDIDRHGEAVAAELKRRHGLQVDILGEQLQARPIQ